MSGPSHLAGLVEEVTPQVVELRRNLHRSPEPGQQEHRTTELIRRFIASNDLTFNDRHPATGGWVDTGDRPRIGFRADIDALPITEPEDNQPKSQSPGWMHACGHDAHAAIAAGIAVVAAQLDVDSRVIFQPAEETNTGGALDLVAEGLVDNLKALIAYHVDPSLPVGQIGARDGPITASSDSVEITLLGPGGHTSRPHRTVDLIDASARVVSGLGDALRTAIDERTPIVTVFGSVHGGSAPNVIPTEVVLRGTVRTLDSDLWDVLPGLVDKSLGSILAITGAGYSLDYRQGIPPVVNDPEIVTKIVHALRTEIDREMVVPTEQSMGGEDFANYLPVTPGALFRLGAASSGGGDLHSASFKFNDAAIPVAITAGVTALRALAG